MKSYRNFIGCAVSHYVYGMETLPLTLALALGGCVTAWLLASQRLEPPRISKTRIGAGLLGGLLIYLLWVSDYPAAWRVPEIVEYLSEFTLSAFRILCVAATGTVLFGSMVALLYLTRPKRR